MNLLVWERIRDDKSFGSRSWDRRIHTHSTSPLSQSSCKSTSTGPWVTMSHQADPIRSTGSTQSWPMLTSFSHISHGLLKSVFCKYIYDKEDMLWLLWLQRFKSNFRVLSGCTEFNRIWCLKGGLRSALGNYAGDTGSDFLLRAMQKPDWDLRSTSFEAPVQSHFSAENPTQLEWNKQKHHNFPQCRFEMVPNGSKWFEIRADYKDVISALNTMSYFNLQN
jgi:hypothetical protein